jgi:type II secretory pathway pseudopilin PulG
MTLVELLIVCFILVLFIAMAAPLLRPATADRKIREAARTINAYVAEAKAYAAQRGRPVGLAFDRAQAVDEGARDPNLVTRLYLAESPPIYAGDILGAAVFARLLSRDDDGNAMNNPDVVHLQQPPWYDYVNEPPLPPPPGPLPNVPPSSVEELFPPQTNILNPGAPPPYIGHKSRWYQLGFGTNDSLMMYVISASYMQRQGYRFAPFRIRFNGRDGFYDGYVQYLGTADPPVFDVANGASEWRFICWAPFSKAGPPVAANYQVEFPPMITGDSVVELPTGSVADLQFSGYGQGGSDFYTGGNTPLVVVFDPGGGVDRVFNNGSFTNRVAKLHFLVGAMERAIQSSRPPNTPDLPTSTLADPASQWVTIHASSGHVTTADNLTPTNFTAPNIAIAQARGFATGLTTTGGR